MVSHLTEGLSSDCAKELQTLIYNLKKMMTSQQPQGALLDRAIQMPPLPPTSLQAAIRPPVPTVIFQTNPFGKNYNTIGPGLVPES